MYKTYRIYRQATNFHFVDLIPKPIIATLNHRRGDEGPRWSNCRTNYVIALHELSVGFVLAFHEPNSLQLWPK